MRYATGLLLAVALVAGRAAAAEAQPAEEDSVEQEIAPDRQAEIKPLDLERPAVFTLTTGDARVDIRAMPDGVARIVAVTIDVEVAAQGSEANLVKFRLARGAGASIWPVERILVTGGTAVFSLDVTAAGWAFVVRADNVGRRGLSVFCDGVPWRLFDGQRIDADREGPKVVFRAMQQAYPGQLVQRVEKRPPRRPERVDRPAVVRAEGQLAGDALPGVIPTVGRDLAWQTIPLPVMAWEVFRPPDVSP